MPDNNSILKVYSLSMPWKTQDPFIFCAYHNDLYPGGNPDLSPNSSLNGRHIGHDFAGKDGWNMYHGTTIPGFPAHPHSGFETVTVVTQGMVDHSDSLGATGRFGNGDVQWLTSGKGVQHAEMFPLINESANPFELFQIWLNLPKKSKKVDPHYKMLWAEDIPVITLTDKLEKTTKINLIAGFFGNQQALSPTPDSWAADPDNELQIWTIQMDGLAEFTIPPAKSEVTRSLYFYQGESISIDNTTIHKGQIIELDPKKEALIINGSKDARFLFLQGRPIKEPLLQYGPFVANTKADLQETMREYQQTQFGGWPWETSDPVNDKSRGRFSRMPDGTEVVK